MKNFANYRFFLAIWCAAAIICMLGVLAPALAVEKAIPESTLHTPPMAPEKSVSTWIPSDVAPGQGLAVNIIYPLLPRYKEGAPVCVVVPGGETASGLGFTTHVAQCGIVEVRFAFPGGGEANFTSSGKYDHRGVNCQKALRDVLLFAGGKKQDVEGRSLQKLVPFKVDSANLGVIGWSNGGNTAVITLDKFVDDLKFVQWIVFYETPLGSLFYPPCLGSATDMFPNPHYRQGTAATGHVLVDWRKLTWEIGASKNLGLHRKAGEPEVPGVAYFDENNDKRWEEEGEFALPYAVETGVEKQFYPPQATQALKRLGIFGKDWPKNVATPAEAEKYFQERDGSLYLNDLAKQRPDLFVCVFGSQLDHMQRQPDHPHIALNYNAWLANRVKFCRLNPDQVYVGAIALMNYRIFTESKPNVPVEADSIETYLEPEGLIPDYLFIEAAAAELADRKHTKKLDADLETPLVQYWNGVAGTTRGEKLKSVPSMGP